MLRRVMFYGLLCVSGLSCAKSTSAPRRESDASTTAAAVPAAPSATSLAKAAEPVELSTLLSEYKGNEVRADGKFKGRRVRVTGKVGDVKKDLLDAIYVTLGTGAQFEIPVVQCFVRDDQASAAATLNAGQQVTLEGNVDGLMMNVLLKDCTVEVPLGERACAALEAPPAVASKCRPSLNEKGETQGYKFEAPSTGGAAGIMIIVPNGTSAEKTQKFLDAAVAKNGSKICGNAKAGVVLEFMKAPDEKQRAEACKRVETL